jgi:hypothetical protein
MTEVTKSVYCKVGSRVALCVCVCSCIKVHEAGV